MALPPKTIADLPHGTISGATKLEVQNGGDGQHIEIDDLLAYISANAPVVKSVQRGTISASASTSVTLSPIDPSKCSVTLTGAPSSSNSPSFPVPLYVSALSTTSMTLVANRPLSGNAPLLVIGWEITEFS